ncbi:MAG: hypothetical protein E7554_03355 [Ruminococcaceae bacterium]|nr:hypothetical protein [Oscillospiraceae bacterium]
MNDNQTDAHSPSGRSRSLAAALIRYTILFFAAWTGYEVLAKPWLRSVIANEAAAQLVSSGVIKNLAWTT